MFEIDFDLNFKHATLVISWSRIILIGTTLCLCQLSLSINTSKLTLLARLESVFSLPI